MQWTSIIWFLVCYAIFASTVIEAGREKRDLSTVKKIITSIFFGRSRKKCASKSLKSRPYKAYEILVVPENKKNVVERGRGKIISKENEPTENGDFTSGIFQETFEALRKVINSLQTEAIDREEINKVILQDNQNTIPVREVPETILFNYEANNGAKQNVPNNLQSIVRFVSPIISMPRKYSYEQIKGDMIEKFTLDQNSDVIVTETRNVNFPRPVHINDRIRQVILGIPSSLLSSSNQDSLTRDHQKSLKPMVYSQFETLSPYRIEMFKDDNSFKAQNKSNVMSKNSDSDYLRTVLASKMETRNKMLQEYLDQLSPSANFNQNLKTLNDLDPYIQPNLPGTVTKITSTTTSIPAIDNTNILTRYTYEQQTNDGVLQYGNKVDVPASDDETISVTVYPNNPIFSGKPIIVATVSDMSNVNNSFDLDEDNNSIKNQRESKDDLRGDIPEFS